MPSVVFACQTQELGVKITFIMTYYTHTHVDNPFNLLVRRDAYLVILKARCHRVVGTKREMR